MNIEKDSAVLDIGCGDGSITASAAFEIINEMTSIKKWSPYLKRVKPPYHFFSDEEYKRLLQEAGFTPGRIELIKKDMTHESKKGFEGFIRTTWLPFTERIPEKQREEFISEAAGLYLKKHPPGKEGMVHIEMVRLEVEALRLRSPKESFGQGKQPATHNQ